MTEETRPDVTIRGDQGTESFGKNAYILAKEGSFSGRGYQSSVFVMLCLVVMIFTGMFFSNKNNHRQESGQIFPTPGLSRNDTNISPKLLSEKDLTNLIPRPRAQSALGKIKVINLGGISTLPIGSEMIAVLESGATDGIVKARLTAPLFFDGNTILPERAVLFGKGKSGDERLFIEFSKAILPDGTPFSIRAQAFDISDKIQGLKGAFVGTRTRKMAGAVAFGFLGGMSEGLQSTNGSIFMNNRPSARDAALAGASKAALDQSQAYIDEMKKSPNIIEVRAGTEIIVIADEPKKKEESNEK